MTTERNLDAVDESLLIAKTRRMIKAIGLPLTLRLLAKWGGTHLYLPQGRLWRQQRSVLAQLIGETAADAFHKEFADGTRRLLLPKDDKILIQIRDWQICQAADASARDLALAYHITERQVQNIRKRGVRGIERRPTNQMDLFFAPESRADAGQGP